MDLYPVSIDREGQLGKIDVALRNDGPGNYLANRVMYQIAVIDGTAYLFSSDRFDREFIEEYNWDLLEEIGPADDVAIEFDGEWEREPHGRFRFHSEGDPWLFWVNDGNLYARHGQGSTITLASSGNVTTVSAVRSWKNTYYPDRDHGLVVAYIDGGDAKYRNRAEQADESVIWESAKDVTDENDTPVQAVNITAFRTIDYRTGFLYEDSGGEIHFTASTRNWAGMGVAPETITAAITNYNMVLSRMYHTVVGDGPYVTDDKRSQVDKWQWGEHDSETITASIDYTVGPLLWVVNTEPILLENFPITENGEENWGKRIRITFDHGITNKVGLEDYIHVKDEADNIYPVISTSGGEIYEDPLDPTKFDGTRELILEVFDFNDAAGAGDTMTVEYISGENRLQGEAGQDLESFIETYTPTNLDPEGFPSPEVEAIYNE